MAEVHGEDLAGGLCPGKELGPRPGPPPQGRAVVAEKGAHRVGHDRGTGWNGHPAGRAAHLGASPGIGRDDRCPARQRLQDGEAERLGPRRGQADIRGPQKAGDLAPSLDVAGEGDGKVGGPVPEPLQQWTGTHHRQVHVEAPAAKLVEEMKAVFAKVRQDASGVGKTIYFEVSSLAWGDPWTAGKGTFMDELAEMLGLTNIFADIDGWGMISQEQVIERNPDYIVTVEMYYGEGPTPYEEIMSREGWQSITAVQNGAVFNADNDEISRPGPRLANAAVALYTFIYGDDKT